MRWLFALLLMAATLVVAGIGPIGAQGVRCEDVESIGTAVMDASGVITLRIHSLPPGPIAEGVFTYAPGDRDYEAIKEHLGDIAPGETKPVRPWC